jgi:chorismate mutase/prephenate dehydratase
MDINEIRSKIDGIDKELTGLFVRRMELSSQAGQAKKETGKPVLDRSREREVLSNVGAVAGAELEMYARTLYGTVFDLSRAYQVSKAAPESELTAAIRKATDNTPKLFPKKASVACQGIEGAYSQQACDRLFPMPDIMYFRSFEGVFQAVSKGLCQYGLLPIENSSNGSVRQVYDLMRENKFYIVRSIRLRVEHRLLAPTGTKLGDIREVISHEQALGQCGAFLSAHPEIKVTVCENTAVAARLTAEAGRSDLACISSRNCAELYNLSILSDKVQNSDNNYTRFICIAKELEIYPGADRVSLMLTLEHKPGSLNRMVSRFASLGLNLNKLESRPIPGQDLEFMFYFDLEASVLDADVLSFLGDNSGANETFVFLGSYSEVY